MSRDLLHIVILVLGPAMVVFGTWLYACSRLARLSALALLVAAIGAALIAAGLGYIPVPISSGAGS